MIEPYLEQLAAQGLLGILLIIIGIAYYQKDKKLDDLQEKRLTDFKCITEKLSELIKETTKSLDNLTEMIKYHEK